VRKHSTTGRRVDEMYLEEKPFLIALPEITFPTERREVRKVQKDGYLPIDGSFYPVPAISSASTSACASIPAASRSSMPRGRWRRHTRCRSTRADSPRGARAAEPGGVLLAPGAGEPFPSALSGAEEYLGGLKRRMNALTPIHLSRIERLWRSTARRPMRARSNAP